MLIRFDRMYERDAHTHTHTPHDGIGRAFKASRGKNDTRIQLSLSLHFYLLYLPLNSCDGNDAF